MNQIEDLPQESVIRLLGIIKAMQSKQPVSISVEELDQIKSLADELKDLETQSEPVYQEIQQIELEIAEKKNRVQELYESIDPKIRYIKEVPLTPNQPRQVTRTVSNENNPINKESVMEVLRANPYGLGNSEVCKKLNVTNDKSNQNRVYNVMKVLESEQKVQSQSKLWKVV